MLIHAEDIVQKIIVAVFLFFEMFDLKLYFVVLTFKYKHIFTHYTFTHFL